LSIGLLIICVYFLIDTMSQQSEQETLRTQITDAIEMIALIPEVPTDLEQRLADIEASLVSEQSNLPEQVNTTQVINTLIDMAVTSQVNVVSLVTTPWSLINVEGYDYLIFTINLDIEGELDNFEVFLRTLEDDLLESLSVQHLAVTWDTEQVIESSLATASLDIAIYAQAPIIEEETSEEL
jgi:hypothetical protein